jgi:hypothetical protein
MVLGLCGSFAFGSILAHHKPGWQPRVPATPSMVFVLPVLAALGSFGKRLSISPESCRMPKGESFRQHGQLLDRHVLATLGGDVHIFGFIGQPNARPGFGRRGIESGL